MDRSLLLMAIQRPPLWRALNDSVPLFSFMLNGRHRRSLSPLSQLHVEMVGYGLNCLTKMLGRIVFGEGNLGS